MTGRRKPPLLIEWPELKADLVIRALNDENQVRRTEIRRLTEAWETAERDVSKMLESVPELKPYIYGGKAGPSWKALPTPAGTGLRVMLIPEGPSQPIATPADLIRDEARLVFLEFLTLDEHIRQRLAGPCAWKNCQQYFWLKGTRRTSYCSRRCCQLAAATRYTRARLDDEHRDKIRRAREAMGKWRTDRSPTDWKTYVHRREPDITAKFLTRAVTNKELKEPKKGRKTE